MVRLRAIAMMGTAALVAGLGCGSGATGNKAAETAKPAPRPAEPKPKSSTAQPAAASPQVAPPAGAAPARVRVQIGTLWKLSRPVQPVSAAVKKPGRRHVYGTLGGVGVGRGGIVGYRRPARPRSTPKVHLGRPTVSGNLDRAVIHRYVRQRLSRLRYCYQRQLRYQKSLSGTVRVRFVIGTNGRVISALASGSNVQLNKCVEAVMRGMYFPRPKSGKVQVYYPIAFVQSGAGSFVPIAPPEPPSRPGSLIRSVKPQPITETESPVREVTERPVPTPSGSAQCIVTDRPEGLDSLTPAIEACYERALDRMPALTTRLFVTIGINDAGVIRLANIYGDSDQPLRDCVGEAVNRLVLSGPVADELRGQRAVFSLLLDKQGGTEPSSAWTRVTATDHDLRLGLRLMASELRWDKLDALQRAAWQAVATEVAGADQALVLRVADGVDSGAVVSAMTALPDRHRRLLRFARRIEGGDWKVVNPVTGGSFAQPCGHLPASRVSVLINPKGIWIGTDKGRDHVDLRDGEHDILDYARRLRALRRHLLTDRSDLELAVAPGVPYEVFAKALEIAIDSGFFDAEVKRMHEIRNPMNLQPRVP